MKKMLALALAAMMSLSLFGCAQETTDSAPATTETPTETETTTESTESTEAPALTKLVMGTSADYPPFEFHIMEDGTDKVVGIDVAMSYIIAEDMGLELEIAEMNFDNLFTLMGQGNCDMVVAALETSPEREANASCSDPYYTDLPAMILVKAENADLYTSIEDFDGKSVGAQTATTKADIVTGEMTGALPVLMTSVVDLVNALSYDKCDAVVVDGAVAMQYAEANEGLVIADVALGEAYPFRVWVAKDDPLNLLPSINETIARITTDGTMEEIIEVANAQSDNALS